MSTPFDGTRPVAYEPLPWHEDDERACAMAKSKPMTTQVLEALERNPACEFDRLVADCSEFTWKQLFDEVDRLNRNGQLYLTAQRNGRYILTLPSLEASA
jgi:hypothetical protein